MAKIENFAEHHGGIQRSPLEVANFFKEYVKTHDVEKVVIVFNDVDDQMCFICGSKIRDYSFMELNWDIDALKNFILFDIELE